MMPMRVTPRYIGYAVVPTHRYSETPAPSSTIVVGLGAWAGWIGPGKAWETEAAFYEWLKVSNQ